MRPRTASHPPFCILAGRRCIYLDVKKPVERPSAEEKAPYGNTRIKRSQCGITRRQCRTPLRCRNTVSKGHFMSRHSACDEAKAVVRRNTEEVQGKGKSKSS